MNTRQQQNKLILVDFQGGFFFVCAERDICEKTLSALISQSSDCARTFSRPLISQGDGSIFIIVTASETQYV